MEKMTNIQIQQIPTVMLVTEFCNISFEIPKRIPKNLLINENYLSMKIIRITVIRKNITLVEPM